MSAFILEICDKDWNRLALTTDVLDGAIVSEELGSAEGQATVSIPVSDPAVAYLPDQENNEPEDVRFRIYRDADGSLMFAGHVDRKRITFEDDRVTFGGMQRGIALAGRNVGRRDFMGWPMPVLLRELTRDNIGRAPFASVEPSNEAADHLAINVISGEPVQKSYWGVTHDGTRPSTFADVETLDIDLGRSTTVNAVRVIAEWWSGKWYKWRLYTSTNGSTWTERHDKDDAGPRSDRGVLVELGGLTIRYVRVEVYASSDGYPRIAQVMTLADLADIGDETTYVVPWVENDDSGNVTEGSSTREIRVGAFPDAPLAKGQSTSLGYVRKIPLGDSITHTFRGTSTAVYFTQDNAAKANIYLDDVFQEEVTIPADSHQLKAFEVTALASGVHELRVEQSAGTPEVDFFAGNYESSYRTIEAEDGGVGYSGKWSTEYNTDHYGYAYRVSRQSGSQVYFDFYGDSIKYIGTMAPTRGIYEFFIDEVSQGTVDAYSATIDQKQVIFEWSGSYGAHTLRARNTGTSNASATDIRIDLDRLEGNWAHNLYLRSAYDSNLALIGRLSEMTNSFMRLNYDGTIDLLGTTGDDTNYIIRAGENEGGEIEGGHVEGIFQDQVSAIMAVGKGTDNNALRVLVQDKTAVDAIGIKIAKIESRDVADAYLLTRMAWQTLQESKLPQRQYTVTYDESALREGTDPDDVPTIGDTVRLYAPDKGITGDAYRIVRRERRLTPDESVTADLANRRDNLSKLLTRATRDLSVTTNTPQGFPVVAQYGGNAENFVAETGGSTFRSAELDFYIADNSVVLEVDLRMKITKYRSYERDTTSGGGSTSGASSASSSGGGGGSTESSTSENLSHSHQVFDWVDNTPPAVTNREYTAAGAGPGTIVLGTSAGLNIDTSIQDIDPSHSHDVTIPSHTHGITHTHTTPAHTHTQDYDIHEEGSLPGAVSILVDGTTVDSIIDGPFTASSGNDTFDIPLTGIITTPGWHTLRFEAASGKGRITPYVIVKTLQLQ